MKAIVQQCENEQINVNESQTCRTYAMYMISQIYCKSDAYNIHNNLYKIIKTIFI